MSLRPIKIIKNYLPQAEGSCLISMGNTTVLCAASVESKVPAFIENEGLTHGWVTAEYSMLPRSGSRRTPRHRGAGGGRSQEISRLIGRSLRGIVDLEKLGKRAIILDCDVIKSDGGTRTTSINGAFIALYMALRKLKREGVIDCIPIKEHIGAISVGIVKGEKVVDLCAQEDNGADVDMNLVMTDSGKIIEIQGTSEKVPFSRADLNALINMGQKAIKKIIKCQKKVLGK
ncbi:MAG: ribonuclease PH [Elusimicrobiota bacterium]